MLRVKLSGRITTEKEKPFVSQPFRKSRPPSSGKHTGIAI
jgi:hypothetical protein